VEALDGVSHFGWWWWGRNLGRTSSVRHVHVMAPLLKSAVGVGYSLLVTSGYNSNKDRIYETSNMGDV